MSGPFPHSAGGWLSVKSLIVDQPQAARPPRGLSAIFSIAVIAGVALLTAAAVATFFVEPSQSAADKTPAIDADQPVLPASLVPMLLPVRKVVTTPVRVAIRRSPEAEAVDAATVEDTKALEQQDPRWARSGSERSAVDFAAMMQPRAFAIENGIAATGTAGLFDPEAETAAIEPEQVKPTRAHDTKPSRPAADAADDDTLPTRIMRINRGVNMRSRPESASVLTVVPKAANVKLVGCKIWCEVIYKGLRGYVFKDFVGGRAWAPAKPKSAKETTSAKNTKTNAAQRPALPQPPGVKAISARLQ